MYVDPDIAGFVIGKESCSGVDSTEYWLIDFTWRENNPQIGDTLILDDFKHTNVLKMKISDSEYRRVGASIAVIYRNIITNKRSNDCVVSSPSIYFLKEMIPLAVGYPGN